MSLLMKLNRLLPGVKGPEKRLNFKEKLKWSGAVLVLYFIMSEVKIFGFASSVFENIQSVQAIMGSSFGTLATLGIGPIVSSSIILQMLTGADIIPWDLNSKEGKTKFQGTQKLLAVLLSLFEAIAFVSLGAITPVQGAGTFVISMMIIQIALGGWLIIFMDEVISKWGFGSGVSLFILSGVSKGLLIGSISPPGIGMPTVGKIPQLIVGLSRGTMAWSPLIALVSTLGVFFLVVYAQSMKVEIPLTMGNVRGFGRKWPLKFIYTGVLPVIFTSALLTNARIFGNLLSSKGMDLSLLGIRLFGEFSSNGSPISPNALFYYLFPPQNFLQSIIYLQVTPVDVLRVIGYTSFYMIGAVMFSIFWMKTSGQDPNSVADQIQSMGMKVPGFRKDKRVIIRILNRYIPSLTVLGGAFVGFLAAFANWTNVFGGSGTGILLAVMISYKLYEEIAQRHMEDMHPALRKFMQSTG